MTQRERAERLRNLHQAPPILVLPNAWDVGSARIFASVPGCRALATTSSGIAWALGYPDGERISRDEMLAAVERIARSVDVPVTADLEAGYDDPAATAEGAIAAGTVGLNLEDGTRRPDDPLVPTEVHVRRIEAVRAVADSADVPLVINARTDVFLAQVGKPEERFEHAVERANVYLAAGADCAFVPAVTDGEEIARLARAIRGPLNVLAMRTTPPVAELERLGVARVTVGGGVARTALALARRLGRQFLEEGTFGGLDADGLTHAELNELLG